MTKNLLAVKDAAEKKSMTKDEFAVAVTVNEKKLYIAALSVVRNTEDARDAVASAVAHAWEKLDSLRDKNKFDGWLLQITYNEAKKMRRHGNEFVSLSDIEDNAKEVLAHKWFQSEKVQGFICVQPGQRKR